MPPLIINGSSICPACREDVLKIKEHFKFRDFDRSLFNLEADFGLCANCGFVRVLVPFDDSQIADHYTHHSLYSSLSGVGVGGSTVQDVVRYEHYFSILQEQIRVSETIADVGCSKGGFLKFLNTKIGVAQKLIGIDLDIQAIAALKDDRIEGVQGSALNLNLADDSLNLAFYTHLLEHILDLDGVLSEMNRVIRDDGVVFIEVPNAEGYADARVHNFYWAGMKEHVNHFTANALCNLLARHGMEVIRVVTQQFPMKSGVFYPSLIIVAKIKKNAKSLNSNFFGNQAPQSWLSRYMSQERQFMDQTKRQLDSFLHHHPNPGIWGIGLEFFNLLAFDMLNVSEDVTLFDANVSKQSQHISGFPILAPECLSLRESFVCTAPLSRNVINQQLIDGGIASDKIFFI